MTSKRERNRLAAQAWMAQTETDYRKKQEEMARQDPEEHPVVQTYSTYSNWLEKYEALYDLADQTRQMLGALAVLCVLQFIVIVFLIFEVVRS